MATYKLDKNSLKDFNEKPKPPTLKQRVESLEKGQVLHRASLRQLESLLAALTTKEHPE